MNKQNTNPYVNDADNKPLLLRSVISYIDILGYKELIESDTSEYNLIFYRNALKWAYETLEPFAKNSNKNCKGIAAFKNEYEVRGFLDNIVIGYPIGTSLPEVILEKAFSLLAHMQLRMIFDGYFLRGAIAIGELHLDDTIVFGRGLLEAQAAEKNACNPRIILAESAKEQALESSGLFKSRYLLRDSDSQYFLNYIEDIMLAVPEGDPSLFELSRHKTIVESNLHKYIDEPKILSKYLWVAQYHNNQCQKYQKHVADSYKIAFR